jgi:hypothetical protein
MNNQIREAEKRLDKIYREMPEGKLREDLNETWLQYQKAVQKALEAKDDLNTRPGGRS